MTHIQDQSVTVIIQREGKVLVNLRDDKDGIWEPDRWSFIGGHVEKGEMLHDALVREVYEETGRILGLSGIKALVTYCYDAVMVITTVFVYRILCDDHGWQYGDIVCNEGVEMKWVYVDEVISGLIGSTITGRLHAVAPDHISIAKEFRHCLL